MAEAIAVISFVSAVYSLADFGTRVVKRLNEFRTNVHGLPQTFLHVSDQLPLLIDTVNLLHRQANDGHLSPQAEIVLRPVVEGILAQLTQLDSVLVKVLPSAKASTWEKGIKAVRSLRIQKTVDDFASVIDRYVSNLTIYQTTHNSDLIKTLINLIERMNSSQLHDVQVAPRRKPYFMVRYQTDEDFIGREEIMEEISRRFGRKSRVAIAGMGGVGYAFQVTRFYLSYCIDTNCSKSRIAIEYCYQYRRNSPDGHVFWVHGGTRARFEAAYQDMARTMKIPGFDDPKSNTLQQVSDWLGDEDNGTWLMVLDNADDAEVWLGRAIQASQQDSQVSTPLVDYIPRGSHGIVLITTRDNQLGKRLANVKEKPIDVLPFGPTEAEILLRSKLSEDNEISQKDANEFTEALDFLPLTITQAAAYLDQNNTTIAKYLQLFRAGKADIPDLLKKDIYDPARDYEIQNSVFQTWKISFNQISKQNPRAAELLSLMAVLDRQAITENLLRTSGEPELEFTEAIQKLKAFSLITEEIKPSIFSMHRLVQLSTQKWLEQQNELSRWQEAALCTVAECCPLNGDFENWISLEAISPHLQVVLDYQFGTKPCQLQRAEILYILGWYNSEQGRYSIAHRHYSESLVLRESYLGPKHGDTLNSMNNLALVLHSQGNYDEAERIHRRALEVSEKVLGPEHPGTLISMGNLAQVLRHQGNYDDAERIQRRALELREKVLGPEHPDTLISMCNLALVLHSQGNYDDAERIHRRALEVKEKVLGPEHPDTLTSMNSLGMVLHSQGNYDDAERIQRRALELREKVLGPEHPNTLIGMGSLAQVLHSQGNYDEAERIHRRALEVKEKVLGPEHPGTLTSMNNLGLVLHSQGNYDDAERIHRRVLEVWEKVLGPEHPDTLISMGNLAQVLHSQGNFDEAERIHRRALEVSEKALGPEHPDTLISMGNLAQVLHSQGNYDDAERIHRRALEVKEKVLSPEHPDTLISMGSLAQVLHSQGNYDEAERIHRPALEVTEKVLGPEHPDTLISMGNLAQVLHSQGNYDEAERMHRRALEVSEKVLGPEHPDTLIGMGNLARVLHSQGNYDDAERIHRRALEVKERVLGPEHPDTMVSIGNLARVLRRQGNYGDAERMHRQVLEVWEKVLGPEHPDTLISMGNLARVLRSQGNYDEAERMHRRALEVWEKVLGPEHPDTLISMNNLGLVLRSQGKYDEAKEMNQRALEAMEKVLGPEHPDTLSSVYGLARVHQCQKQYDEASILYQRACLGYQKILGSDHPDTLKCSNNYLSMLGSLPQGGIPTTQNTLVRQESGEIRDRKSLELVENAAKGVDSLPQIAAQDVLTGNQYLNIKIRGQAHASDAFSSD
jgi:tetratricopeptide (TPR) repeat protein